MRIGEIADKTGLSISNIRFYEKKGLIGPQRDKDSKYRNYTDSDLERLNLIILFRKMDISVETIGEILDGLISTEDVLQNQIIDLTAKQQMLQSSIDLCQKIIDDKSCDNLDAEYYLNYVHEEEAKGNIFEKFDDVLDDFASFTQFDRFIGSSYLGWHLFANPALNRLVNALWLILFLSIPFIGIIDDIMDENGPSITSMIFWIIWLIFIFGSFINYHLTKNKEKICAEDTTSMMH